MQALSASGALLVSSLGQALPALVWFWQNMKVGMVRTMRSVLLVCAFLTVMPIQAQPPKPESGPASIFPGAVAPSQLCTLEGQTVDAGTGNALRGVRLTLRVGGERLPSPGVEVVSDLQGRFRFVNLHPGSYILLGAQKDYAPFTYQPRIVLSPGQPVAGLVVQMVRAGRITGKVLDDRGKRVGYAGVVVIPAGSSQPRPEEVLTVIRGSADASGEFDFRNLPPGQYVVWASPVPLQPLRRSEEGDAGVERTASGRALRSVYFPSAPNAASATILQVVPGMTQSGVKVRLRKGAVYVISGSVINMPAKVAYENLVVRLRSPATPWRWPGVSVKPNGGFVAKDVEPGTYNLYLEEEIPQSYVGIYGGASDVRETRRRGLVTVTVTDRDIAGVTLSY